MKYKMQMQYYKKTIKISMKTIIQIAIKIPANHDK